jgi:Pterin binding enzyme
LTLTAIKASVAARAIELGAVLVNDVWGLQKDPGMAEAVAVAEAAIVIMHNRAQNDAAIDIVADIRRFFTHSLTLEEKAGIPRARIILDPGIAFGKTALQNVEVVTRLNELQDALRGHLTVNPRTFVCSDDLVLVLGTFTLSGRRGDGTAFERTSRFADVLRRQPDGRGLLAVDNPCCDDSTPLAMTS